MIKTYVIKNHPLIKVLSCGMKRVVKDSVIKSTSLTRSKSKSPERKPLDSSLREKIDHTYKQLEDIPKKSNENLEKDHQKLQDIQQKTDSNNLEKDQLKNKSFAINVENLAQKYSVNYPNKEKEIREVFQETNEVTQNTKPQVTELAVLGAYKMIQRVYPNINKENALISTLLTGNPAANTNIVSHMADLIDFPKKLDLMEFLNTQFKYKLHPDVQDKLRNISIKKITEFVEGMTIANMQAHFTDEEWHWITTLKKGIDLEGWNSTGNRCPDYFFFIKLHGTIKRVFYDCKNTNSISYYNHVLPIIQYTKINETEKIKQTLEFVVRDLVRVSLLLNGRDEAHLRTILTKYITIQRDFKINRDVEFTIYKYNEVYNENKEFFIEKEITINLLARLSPADIDFNIDIIKCLHHAIRVLIEDETLIEQFLDSGTTSENAVLNFIKALIEHDSTS